MSFFALIGPIGPTEMLVILVIGLLIFGNRLPEVGRSLGRGLMEFKKGLKGMQDEVSGIDRESDRLIEEEMKARRRAIPDMGSPDDGEQPPPTDPRLLHHGEIEDPKGTEGSRTDASAEVERPAGDPQPDAGRS